MITFISNTYITMFATAGEDYFYLLIFLLYFIWKYPSPRFLEIADRHKRNFWRSRRTLRIESTHPLYFTVLFVAMQVLSFLLQTRKEAHASTNKVRGSAVTLELNFSFYLLEDFAQAIHEGCEG